jgi:hypothetical protein
MPINQNFIDEVVRGVERFQRRFDMQNSGHAFAAWAIHYIHELDDDLAIINADTLSRGDGGGDGCFFDNDSNIFNLYQSKYSADPNTTFGPDPCREILNFLNIVSDRDTAYDRSPKCAEIHNKFVEAQRTEATITLNVVVFGTITEPARTEFINQCQAHPLTPQPEIWDLIRLHELWVMRNTTGDLHDQKIRIPINNDQMFLVPAPHQNLGIERSYVINFKSTDFVRAISRFIPMVFSLNVRQYLGGSNKINKKIKKTITDQNDRNHFWHYNNGITIIADAIEIFQPHSPQNPTDTPQIDITNPQIVNGAQTIFTMHKNSAFLTDEIQILARVIVVNHTENGKKKKLKISETTNSQSPVNTFDMRSNDRVQVVIQSHFQALNPPWFYERKRGEWNNVPRNRAIYADRKICMIDLSQSWYSYIGCPAKAITQKEELFTDLDIYTEIFSEERDVRLYILSKKIFDLFNDNLSADNLGYLQEITGDFPDVTLQKLLTTEKLVVAHCVALSKIIFDRRYGSIDGRMAESLINILSDVNAPFRRNLFAIIFTIFADVVRRMPMNIEIRWYMRQDTTITELNTLLNQEIARRAPYASLEQMFVDL